MHYIISRNTGFTMVELIVAILGILSVTVLPKFINLSGSAQKTKNDATLGSLSQAVNMTSLKS